MIAKDHTHFSIPNKDELPRMQLTEKAFRMFEPFIARAATTGTFTLYFDQFPGRIREASTFIARFNDARVGYEKYKYQSNTIPYGFNMRYLKAVRLIDGGVRIHNLTAPSVSSNAPANESNGLMQGQAGQIVHIANDHTSIEKLFISLNDNILQGPISVVVTSQDDLTFLRSMADKYLNTEISDVENGRVMLF